MFYNSLDYYQAYNIPSTVHTTNDATTAFFERNLFQRAISRYDFTLPKEWEKDFVLYILWAIGFGAVFNTEDYGLVFQPCSFAGGLNIWFEPVRANVHTPLINEDNMIIGEDCEILRINPDWFGCWDIIHYYAEKLSLISQSFDMNIENTKLAYFIACDNKADAETLKKVLDKANSGEPNVFYKANSKKPSMPNDKPIFEEYTRDISNTFIADKIIQSYRDIIDLFNIEIGIPTINDKKERMLTDEVNKNNTEILSRAIIWRDTLKKCMDRCNKLFGTEMNVELHNFDLEGVTNAS